MSVVDTWNWDKLKAEEEDYKVTVDEKIQTTLYNFENDTGLRPNRIVMGCNLVDELAKQFYTNSIPMKTLKEMAENRNLGVTCKYEGIPIKVDYDNPDILEVGYMVNWMENKL